MTGTATAKPSPLWAQSIRLLLVVTFVVVCLTGMVDSLRAWRTKSILSSAAGQAAQIVSVNPLSVDDCKEANPCPVVWAAAAAKNSLARSGFSKAGCIDPQKPTVAGVLVWTFSCDGTGSCPTAPDKSVVCLKVDMTAVGAGSVPSTNVTVQYPHTWVINTVLSSFRKSLRVYPQNISVNVLRPATASSGRIQVGSAWIPAEAESQKALKDTAIRRYNAQPTRTEGAL